MTRKTLLQIVMVSLISITGILAIVTSVSLQTFPSSLEKTTDINNQPQLLDRNGLELNKSYQGAWNFHEKRALHDMPNLLKSAFIQAEDRRFESHNGVDWQARMHAVWQNIKAGKKVRGASTITEQVVRMLHPRPRTLWSRWLEGFEAQSLEGKFTKSEILEFYLNQVPYARQWRGVVQAAKGYFGRGLETLHSKEMLALAVLVRAPGRMDLYQHPEKVEAPLERLAIQMRKGGLLDKVEFTQIISKKSLSHWDLKETALMVNAPHFVRKVRKDWSKVGITNLNQLTTTLDGLLNEKVNLILEQRLEALALKNVHNAAALVADLKTGEVLVWSNVGGSDIDVITTPRQPGSTLKPLLYALAMEKGWTAATTILDDPLSHRIGSGLHSYHNYSRKNYGSLRLRDTLGNSLNIPAIRAVQFTGVNEFLFRLHELHFDSLKEHAEFYGEGLALGNGEVTLLELVRAYATLANKGIWKEFRISYDIPVEVHHHRVMQPEVTSIISDILSDSQARTLEFGFSNLLSFPVQTAVKTGTSTDYRDAWAVGYSHRYVAGVWMGNLDRGLMQEVTGSSGPALALRSIFAELERNTESKSLYLSAQLESVRICQLTGKKATTHCPTISEWFRPEFVPKDYCPIHNNEHNTKHEHTTIPRLIMPTPGLHMALDPRIPDQLEAFPIRIDSEQKVIKIEWYVDAKKVAITGEGEKQYLWPLTRGSHIVHAIIWGENEKWKTQSIKFLVK